MKTFPAIVIVTFNRPNALIRLLASINKANYKNYANIPLIISIDGGGENNHEVNCIANEFEWRYGHKQVIAHPKNLGLRKHVISCGDLTQTYEQVIILEEDCYVSRNFYDFAVKSIVYYKNEPKIAGISLYAYNWYESAAVPFQPLYDGYDVFFMQVPGSLGQIWTREHWEGFRQFYATHPEIDENDKIPPKVKTWPESSWKKYYYKYMVEKDLYFMYPQVSFLTNFGDIGTHFNEPTQLYQVNIEYCLEQNEYKFLPFKKSLNKYDAYFELLSESLIQHGVKIDPDTCIDLNGSKQFELFQHKYALSAKNCEDSITSYSNELKPTILNSILNIQGQYYHYGLIEHFKELPLKKKHRLLNMQYPLSFKAGKSSVIISKYYKVGYYILHPFKITEMFKRKLRPKT